MKEQILSALGPHQWAKSILWFDSIDSTNTQAKRLASQGAPEGTVLIADQQTGGRGRMGRVFQSPAGKGIYLSVILRPACKPTEIMHLTCAVAVAMCNAVEKVCRIRPGIKWINDLILQQKKLGGILTELSLHADSSIEYAVVGVGINCSQVTEDFPQELQPIAISLEQALLAPVDRSKLAAEMIVSLEKMAQNLRKAPDSIMDTYRADCLTLGKNVVVHTADQNFPGLAVDIDNCGSLTVRTEDGSLCKVQSGEVSVRNISGYC